MIWGRIGVWMVWFGGGCSEGWVWVLSGDHQGVLWGWVGRRGGLSGVECKFKDWVREFRGDEGRKGVGMD